MTVLAAPLQNDPATLRATLIAERAAHAAEVERLTQIIKELQRHRFGRRAETLPIDQLELALEKVQQGEAEDAAGVETAMRIVAPRAPGPAGLTADRCPPACPGSR
jgi:hypothetical protein